MRIGSDISLFASNQLSRTQSAIARALQRLSTGLRVNSPQDDPAAYSESVTLNAGIRGYTQAILNINSSVGLINTASSALDTQLEIIQKMRELAVQASNGSLSTTDRQNINTQVQALYQEFQRITTTTQFNGMNLLDGSFGTKSIQIGSSSTDQTSVGIASEQSGAVFEKAVANDNFAPRQTATAGTTPGDVTAADFNGDGKPDVASLDWTTGKVYVSAQTGSGTFANIWSGQAGSGAAYIGSGDFNGDGIQDIVTEDMNDNTISLFLGNGDGTFKPRVTLQSGSLPYGFAVGDLNHDGKLDLLSADQTDQTISVFLGNGDGTFQTRKTTSAPNTGGGTLRIADLNNDGNPDLIFNDVSQNNVYTMIGNGDGTFKAEVLYAEGLPISDIELADLNGDGKTDIGVVVSNNLGVGIGNGDGTFKATSFLLPTNGGHFVFADMNGDGRLDIVAASLGISQKGLTIYLNNGDGTFGTGTIYKNIGSTTKDRVLAIDMNGDGIPDIVTADDSAGTVSIFDTLTTMQSAQSSINVSTQSSAQALISVLDSALTNIKSQQSNLAAVHNRLDISNSFDALMVQNLGSALDNATQVDIAQETSNLVRNQILEQAQVSVLAQANLNQEMVLKLLTNL